MSAPPVDSVRKAVISDARALIDLLGHLDKETRYMVVTVPDRRRDVGAVIDYLKGSADSDTHCTFVIPDEDKLVGMLVTSADAHPYKIGSIDVDLGVRLAWHRRGYGRALLKAAEQWARERGAHRLQLRVMTHNAAAIALYQACGFEIEGTLRHHLKIDDQFIDQYFMAKLLG